MAAKRGVTKVRAHRGSRPEPLTPDEFASWFDTLTGPEGRELKVYPETLDSVRVRWRDGEENWHEPESFDDLMAAYEGYLTGVINLGTMGATRPRVSATYWPGGDRVRAEVEVDGGVSEVDEIVDATAALFPDPMHRELVFLSWGGEHSEAVAAALVPILERRLPRTQVFFSSDSIEIGSDPMKAMLEDGVLKAVALVVILTRASAGNPWTIWETAAAWARGAKVVPLFVNVRPGDVGGPLTVRVQGAQVEDRKRLDRAIRVVAQAAGDPEPLPITDDEHAAVMDAVTGPGSAT